MTTQIHHYHQDTGEYAGSSNARLDPLDKEPMVPANATLLPPVTVAVDETAVFNGVEWIATKDCRGESYYMPDGSHHVIERLGEVVPGNALDAPPPPVLTDVEITAQAISQVDAICDRVYTAYPSRGARYEQKYAEALRYKAADYPHPVSGDEYPYLVAETAYRPETKHELADLIIAKATVFNQFGAQAEAARAELPGAVAAAATQADKQTAADAIVDRIETLALPLEA